MIPWTYSDGRSRVRFILIDLVMVAVTAAAVGLYRPEEVPSAVLFWCVFIVVDLFGLYR